MAKTTPKINERLSNEERTKAESHLGLVENIARKRGGRFLAYDERVQAGAIGLLHAIRRHDESKWPDFEQYAKLWIYKEIRLEEKRDAVIVVPAEQYESKFQSHQFHRFAAKALSVSSIDSCANDDGIPLSRRLADKTSSPNEHAPSPMIAAMNRAIESLGEKHRRVLETRTFTDVSFSEIGRELGVSRARAQQVYKEAVTRARKSMNAVLAEAS